jgi:outer membrane lipoprotein-sorting protein
MKKLILLIMLATLALPAYAAENQPQSPEPAATPAKTEKAVKDAEANVAQTCWSARKCSGKVLNHKDRHNCKNSGGKSWSDNNGTCYNNL